MKVQSLINGKTIVVLVPETTLEEEILKNLSSQRNEIIEARQGFAVGGVTYQNALIIQPVSTGRLIDDIDLAENES